MKIETIASATSDRKQWLEARQAGIGGSDVAALAGLSKWSTALDVYLDKVNPIEDDGRTTNPQYWGNRLEDLLADEARDVAGIKVRRRKAIVRSRRNPILIGSLDREIVGGTRGPGVLEIKTAYAFDSADGWGDAGLVIGHSSGASEPIVIDPEAEPAIPAYYFAQVQHYLAVTGRSWAYLAALSMTGREFRIYYLTANADAQAALEEVATAFWRNHVEAKVPPAAEDSKALERLYPLDSGDYVPASQDIELELDNLKAVRQRIKDLEKEKAELELRVKSEIGEASGLVGIDGKPLATWKASTSKRIDGEWLKSHHPEIWIESRKESTSRRFLVK